MQRYFLWTLEMMSWCQGYSRTWQKVSFLKINSWICLLMSWHHFQFLPEEILCTSMMLAHLPHSQNALWDFRQEWQPYLLVTVAILQKWSPGAAGVGHGGWSLGEGSDAIVLLMMQGHSGTWAKILYRSHFFLEILPRYWSIPVWWCRFQYVLENHCVAGNAGQGLGF